jgi:capsular polysaccharide biosynthesis protein
MNNSNYSQIFKEYGKTIAVFVAVMIFVGLLVTVFQPFKYRATVQTLVIENGQGLDAYSAIRSAEKINNSLVHIVYSTSFRDKVMQMGFTNSNIFPTDPLKLKKMWGETITAHTVPETGILAVDVYLTDPKEAVNLAKSVAYVLSISGGEYIGSKNVTIKTIDQPIVSAYPVKPNIPLNLATSVALGLVLALGYILLTYNGERVESRVQSPESRVQSPQLVAEDSGFRIQDLGSKIQEREETELGNRSSEIGARKSESAVTSEMQIPVVSEETEAKPVPVQVAEEPVRVEESENDAREFYKMLFPEKS